MPDDPALPTGSEVVVRSLGRKRGVITGHARDGRYQVRIGGVTMWCRADAVELPEAPRTRKGADRRRQGAGAPVEAAREPGRAARVDLHGMTVDAAVARTVEEIDRALREGADRLEVVHGKGTGRVRAAVHRHVKGLPVVKAVRLDDRNPGVSWIYF